MKIRICYVLTVSCLFSACSAGRMDIASGGLAGKLGDYSGQANVSSQAINQAPDWMFRLPKDSGVIYENGTAVSGDLAMADLKAKTFAYVKICTSAGGKVRSQMKMHRADNDNLSTEESELTARSICPDVDVAGIETIDTKHVLEGGRFRSYVLVALPIVQKNTIQSMKRMQDRSRDAFGELDELTAVPRNGAPENAKQSERQGSKDASRNGIDQDSLLLPVKAVSSNSAIVQSPNGDMQSIDLMDTGNVEYAAKRASALKKGGALIGQISVQ